RPVDDAPTHRVLREEGRILPQRHEALARGQPGRGRLLDLEQGVGIPVVVLEPLHVVLLEQLGDAQDTFRPEVVVEVEAEPDRGPYRLAEGADEPVDGLEDLHGGRAVRGVDAAREAGEGDAGGVAGNYH